MSDYLKVYQSEKAKEEKKIEEPVAKIEEPVVEIYEPIVSKPTEAPVEVKDILPKKSKKKAKSEND